MPFAIIRQYLGIMQYIDVNNCITFDSSVWDLLREREREREVVMATTMCSGMFTACLANCLTE